MFNMWKPYPKYKPKKKGWYICTIRYGEEPYQSYVMQLYYNPDRNEWASNVRQNVFDTYKVYAYAGGLFDKEPNKKRIYTDHLCIRDDVIAFKRQPKIYIPKKYRKNWR